MFKSKSFELINEHELKKCEKQYDSKKCLWTHVIVITSLIGFMLLLLLTNVQLTGTVYLASTTTLVTDATTSKAALLTTSLEFDSESARKSAQLNIDSNQHEAAGAMARAKLACQADDNNPCKISCSGGVSSVQKTLETQQTKCLNDTLEFTLQYCEFPAKTMKTDFLKGNFFLHSLTISNCDLSYIWVQAFNQDSVSNYLKTLILEGTQFDYLNDDRFLGLKVITYFRLDNNEPGMLDFLGASFLMPMAATLNETNLVQHTTRNTKYNILSWFTGANFQKLLRVDLSNNYLPDTLVNRTFLTLTEVQELILANCQIRSMQSGTFDAVIKTLHYLDLSNNQLKTLSGDFLRNSGSNFKMELSANSWECTCDNSELIKFIQNSAIDLAEEPTCTSPDDMHGLSLKYVSLQCGDIIPTTTPDSTSTTESQDTSTSTNEPQDTSTSSTEPGTTTPQDTSTPITTTNEPQDTSTSSETTTPQDTTTPSTKPTNPIVIVCKDYTKYTVFNQTIRNYDAFFEVYSESSTSVVLLVLNDMSKISLIYFIPKMYFNSQYSETAENSSAKVSSRLCERVVTTTVIHIQGLVQHQTYVFCLVPHDETKISPFNCRSHQLVDLSDPRESWLFNKDITWLVPVVVTGIIVCVIIGSCIIYWLLRWRPTWLCGSKRLIKMGCKPHEMLLLPKVDRASLEYQYLSGHARRLLSVSDVQERDSVVDLNDYMQFYKNVEISKLKKAEFLPEYLPPSDRAPTIPSSSFSGRPTSTQSTLCADDIMQQCNMTDLDNIYQSLDHYELID